MLTHRRRLHSFLAAVAVLAVCLVAWAVFHGKPAKASKPQAVPVSVATAAVADVPVTVNVLGSAQAWTSDTIVAQVSGLLRSVYFVEGTDVRAGQLLAQIDPAPFRAALTQAQGTLRRDRALLAGARVDLARYQTLTQQDSIARQTFDDQTALVHQDEGVVQLDEGIVENAQINLRWCRITSPITGRTGVRSVDPGNFVAPSAGTGTTSAATGATTGPIGIVIVNQIDPIAVTFSVPQGAGSADLNATGRATSEHGLETRNSRTWASRFSAAGPAARRGNLLTVVAPVGLSSFRGCSATRTARYGQPDQQSFSTPTRRPSDQSIPGDSTMQETRT